MAAPAPLTKKVVQAVVPVHSGNNRVSGHLSTSTTPGALTPGNLSIGESRQVIQVIKAGATFVLPQAGLSYYFEFIGTTGGVSNPAFQLAVRAMQSGQPRSQVAHVQGTGLRFGTQSFSGLEIQNTNAADVLFTVDVGGGKVENSYDEFIDNRVIVSSASVVTVAGSVTVTTAAGVPISVKNEPTVSVGYKTRAAGWGDSLLAGGTQAVADGYLGMTRKTIIFSNDDAAAVLQVLDPAGNIVGTIQPSTAWTTDSGGTFTLKNPSAGAVTCHIGEIYYT